ncbi:PhoX family phosphatase [Mesorhizobium sp. M7A.F.Ca.US.006.04.2.1]|uniref:PhoX family protein n=3 Tax=Mesorhizobium TaxID=68287 RepID=UPI000FCA6038|nr:MULTISPECIES: PhoX family phosphatase [unclassified Mesorhizobium]RVA56548.1 PhoX family phosphatase [Mesorhizobium sp. M7A.F.Ca.US.001.01.1.1]RUX72935.1 PhoX family phosphatase [Mesorhizobium sp. M7A.F.Ca.US.005.03.1.1]RUY15811.1 PhoX family phosphatase [Mesorhizobium sp. M7A.F.Ca.US.005.03.2.1]RUY23656.1 PhoX family phosphatase [Mesorhizobium sp. M7A.F.Ca.US.001.04.2.1]RUY44548.1 PhoX family phosphatase [Mesorhizobium sp. M7A.F.Ca.US.001.04.1.1]
MTDLRSPDTRFRTSLLEENDGPAINASDNRTMGEIIAARFSRRGFLKGSLAVSAIAATVSPLALISADEARAAEGSAFTFDELEAGIDDKHHVAPGYDADVLLRWGDPLFADSPDFDPTKQSAEAQAKQFGYNNDYVGYIPIDGSAEHGLLVVNHEYTNPHLMFPGIVKIVQKDGKKSAEVAPLSKEQVDVEMAAHGGTIVEIRKTSGKWQVVRDGKLNRRITSNTEMALSGPVAGHDRVKTNADPSGTKVFGTFNNCAGGVTPWGTYVMAEENIHGYFSGELPEGHKEAANYKRLGIPEGAYEWAAHYERFDLAKEPNEANRFGWIVEVDVNDPTSTPRKRTAMGRFKHEGAESIVARDGRVVFYLGDDERFDYVYKFVTKAAFDPNDHAANRDLLDDGTLHVARFAEDGTVEWLPIVFGQGPLTAENGFTGQADVLIETRRAADLLGATKMDRPEDIQPNAVNGKVYVMLTNNSKRKADQVDAANPRAENAFGHIIEIAEDGGDFTAAKGKWEVLLKCGDPAVADVGATFSTATTANGWFGMPDNCAVDSAGRLWVATDGQGPKATGRTDGLWAVDTEGAARATSKLFFRVPIGAEMCGPLFAPDDQTAFVAVQHPGDGGEDWEAFGRPSYYEDLSTRWPDFKPDMPVRPSVVAITRQGGGKIAV